MTEQFPVSVDPRNKTIKEDENIEAFLESPHSPLVSNVLHAGRSFWSRFNRTALSIVSAPWYQSIASVSGRLVVITPGMRKEEVASMFAKALRWDEKQKQQFVTPQGDSTLPLKEGSFAPGTYFLPIGTSPENAQIIVNQRFTDEVLSRYSDSTEEIVPLEQALIVASLIQRETIENEDMRLISGIIWNRLFINMKLQVDATLQYAKTNQKTAQNWWPKVVPADKYIKSAYNTYQNKGLPPAPIANPSVAAIVAALNPIKTPCIFYFNDLKGDFHCSVTYEEHVALLKEHYGRGR